MTNYLLLPGILAAKWKCGGLLTGMRMAELLDSRVPTKIATYIDRESDYPYLDDILASADKRSLFICAWGGHVEDLTLRLRGRRVVYFAQSMVWKIELPVAVPVICVSRFLMAYLMDRAPHNPIFLSGPAISPDCRDLKRERDIDVLFLARKSTEYLSDRLVPWLKARCRVQVVNEFIGQKELFELYNRSKVYLYSSAPGLSGAVEGFGLQPLEAMLCGCVVFSNLDGGLSDFLEPERNCFKLESYSLAYDAKRILAAVQNPEGLLNPDADELRRRYGEEAFQLRMEKILAELDRFFSHAESFPHEAAPTGQGALGPLRRSWLHRARAIFKKFARRLM